MKSICLFCSYFNSNNIPNYVQFYVKELTRHFNKVVFITNEKELTNLSLDFIKNNAIELYFVNNEGYDFGMWYKAMLKYNIEGYDRVGLVNDSCILFKSLDGYFEWLNNQKMVDYAGMVDSSEITYHLQSFFVTINKNAILPTLQYFKQHGLQAGREEVIKIYELGICKELQEKGLKVKSWFSSEKYMPKKNPSLYAICKMIKDGYPMIKKKIIFNSFSSEEYNQIIKNSFKHNPNYYFSIIKKANDSNTLFNFELLKEDGYNPSFKKKWLLNFSAFRFRFKGFILSVLKMLYRKAKIRELRKKLNPSAAND